MNVTARTTHHVHQGTAAWMELRRGFKTASEAPAALGVSRYMTRSDLLHQKATGIQPEPDAATLARFAAGHEAEATARPLAEGIVGDLFPVTMTCSVNGMPMLASLDGLTLDGDTAWEHKLWNEELAAAVRAGSLPETYTVQMDQELLVSGAKRVLFTCSDGTPERFVWCWYSATNERLAALVAGWAQFDRDLDGYVAPAAVEPKPVGATPETLPALRIEVTGMVTASNLDAFKRHALDVFGKINRTLTTDQEFADAEATVKWCADVEDRLQAAKQHALSQTNSIDQLFRAIDDISAEARRVRLDLDRLVKARKEAIREEIAEAAHAHYMIQLNRVNDALVGMTAISHDPALRTAIGAAMKGKRTVQTLRDAADGVVATELSNLHGLADRYRANHATLGADAHLFPDFRMVGAKSAEDFAALLALRRHQAAEAARQKAEREAAALAQAQREQAAREEAAAREELRRATPVPPAPAPAPVVAAPAPVAAPRADEPATLKLGDINARLAPLRLDAAGMAELGITPARVEGSAKLYRESDFDRLLRAIAYHVDNLRIAA